MPAGYTPLPDLLGLVLPVDAPGHADAPCPQTKSLLLIIPRSEDSTLETHLQYPHLGDSHQRLLVSFLPVFLTNTFLNPKPAFLKASPVENFWATL